MLNRIVVPRSRRSVGQDGPDQLAMLRVEPDGRLVEDEQFGPVQRRAGDVGEAAPPAGQPPGWRAGVRAQPDALDGGGHRRGAIRPLSPASRAANRRFSSTVSSPSTLVS